MSREPEQVLIDHQRMDIGHCRCGWGVDAGNIGQSHAAHVWRELRMQGAAIRAETAPPAADTEAPRERIVEILRKYSDRADGYQTGADKVMEVVAPLLAASPPDVGAQREQLRQIVTELADESPCDVHDGSCHAHGYWTHVRPCPHARAQAILRGGEPQ